MRRVEIIGGTNNKRKGYFHGIFSEGDEKGTQAFAKVEVDDVILSILTCQIRFLDPPETIIADLDLIHSRQNEAEHRLDHVECETGSLTRKVEELEKRVIELEELCKDGDLYKVKALDINLSDLSCGFDELIKRVEGLEKNYSELSMVNSELSVFQALATPTPTLRGEPTDEEIRKHVEALQLDNKAFKNAFANLGIPVHPASVQEQTYTINQLVDIMKDEKFQVNVCISYDHGFGLLTAQQKQQQMFICKEYLNAITNNLPYHKRQPTYTDEQIEKAIDTALISINMFGVPRLKSSIWSELRKNKERK